MNKEKQQQQQQQEAVILYTLNGQDRGDIILPQPLFKKLFGFNPKDDEAYTLSLSTIDMSEADD